MASGSSKTESARKRSRRTVSLFLLNWSGLERLGKSRALRSSYGWFIGVPIAAKAVDALRAHYPELQDLSLPFSWKALFFAAVFIAIASSLYSVLCPIFIRDFSGFSEFEARGLDGNRLADYLHRRMQSPWTRWDGRERQRLLTLFEKAIKFSNEPRDIFNAIQDESSIEQMAHAASILAIDKSTVREAFWTIWSSEDASLPVIRLLCQISYLFGFAIIAFLAYQNVEAVLRHTF